MRAEPQGPGGVYYFMTMPKLIYVDDSLPGMSRKRAGRGWAYYTATGELVRDAAEKQRLNAIALPPAYIDAWFCPAANGHILATGIDAKGRKQYRYHPDFRTMREGEKFDGCAVFGNLLPLVRKRVTDELRGIKLTQERAIASVVRLLDLGVVRVGNEAYTKSNDSYGATTLRQRHADISGNTLRLRYQAKSGKTRDITVNDGTLVRFVKKMQDLPGQNLFQYAGEDGETHQVGSSEVNDFLFEAMGERFTAKNFRTWHASVLGFEILANADEKLSIKALLEQVAQRLGNTPAVTRKSYIHPAVIDLVDRQEDWREGLRLPRSTQWLSREERGLLELLEQSPDAAELLVAA
ncbi:DNA topoisomerase IB [Altererythrobacter aquiaggeris]|uniref:DNA topoisomerase IB n=1 Tax=Aestuarierythrobacter aquiaggeris TaxID=1898396 RepID=UPI003019B91A